MTMQTTPIAAKELAARNRARFPNESADYRRARNALLAEEIELRRHIERVSELRRRLPPGGEVTKTYRFESENGPVTLADLFGDKNTLIIYSYMFGPQRERPCPMCTSLMAGKARCPISNSAWHSPWSPVRRWRDCSLQRRPAAGRN